MDGLLSTEPTPSSFLLLSMDGDILKLKKKHLRLELNIQIHSKCKPGDPQLSSKYLKRSSAIRDIIYE